MMKRTTVTDSRTVTIEIDGREYELSLTEVQYLYDALGRLSGINRHGVNPYWPVLPYQPQVIRYGSGTYTYPVQSTTTALLSPKGTS